MSGVGPRSASSVRSLPRVQCQQRQLGELCANSLREPWVSLEPVFFAENGSGNPPEQGTSLRLAWDPTEIRLLFVAEDRDPWATLTERDAPLYTEEVVELFLDPVGDLESYFEFELNPLNTVFDLVFRRNRSGYRKDPRWTCEGLRTAVCKTSTAWTAEFSIPFAALIADAPRSGSVWRANFSRIDRPQDRPRELSAWSPTYRSTFHTPERFGLIEFV